MAPANSTEADPTFDQLCVRCCRLFDGTIKWNDDDHITVPHLDIYSLSQSARKGCHLCSLILAEITLLPAPDVTIENLKSDLDRSLVDPLKQISITIDGDSLVIYATHSTFRKNAHLRDGSYLSQCVKWRFRIQRAEQDCGQQLRSSSRSNYSESTIEQITQWLKECEDTHSECLATQAVTTTQKMLPTRLLEVVRYAGLRLVMTKDLSHDTKYATLSHSWGGQCSLRLTFSNLKTLQAGIATVDLPKTFRDAVRITIDLGIRYLWIDALCIIQDSTGNKDWSREAPMMGDVYANSYITLAASNSPDSAGGLVFERDPLSVWSCRLMAEWNRSDRGDIVLCSYRPFCSQRQMPLVCRAWTFQECLLSKRVIHFCRDQIRWECFCLAASEAYPTGIKRGWEPIKFFIPILRNNPGSRQTFWERIRMKYSKKVLTKPSDRLIAFSGIARMAYKIFGSPSHDYLAGLWGKFLLRELLWARSSNQSLTRNETGYIAPSWSWASLNGSFSIKSVSEKQVDHAQMLGVQMSPVSDVFGFIQQNAKLIMRCSLCTMKLITPDCRTVSAIQDQPITVDCSLHMDYKLLEQENHAVSLSFDFAPILSLLCSLDIPEVGSKGEIRSVKGLLLKKCLDSNQYLRFGTLDVDLDDKNRHRALKLLGIQHEIQKPTVTHKKLTATHKNLTPIHKKRNTSRKKRTPIQYEPHRTRDIEII